MILSSSPALEKGRVGGGGRGRMRRSEGGQEGKEVKREGKEWREKKTTVKLYLP